MSRSNLHEIDLPQFIVIGDSVLGEVARILMRLGASSPIAVISGPNVWPRYGSIMQESLEENDIEMHLFTAREASIDYAENLFQEVRDLAPHAVIGFGGGKSIDLAKYVAHKLGRPMLSVPTSASHDGIASPFTSLKGVNKPFSFRTVTPTAIIADISIISKAPIRLLRAGSGDLIAKLTAVRDWKLAHKLKGEYYGEYAAKLALLSARHVINYAPLIRIGNHEAVRIVVEGLISSGVAMCIAGSTRPASGSEHLFAHAVEIISPGKALHGELVGLGTIMMMYLHGGRWKKIRTTLRKIGLPTTADEIGLSREEVIEALLLAHKIRPERYTILGETGLTREAAERLAIVTGILKD